MNTTYFSCRPEANKDEPIYIVEVGAGHGKLGFLILNHLAELSEFMPTGRSVWIEDLNGRCSQTLCLRGNRFHGEHRRFLQEAQAYGGAHPERSR